MFAGPEESELRDSFYECFSDDIPFMDTLNLKELAAAFSQIDVLIGNDTGPTHLAGAVGCPVVLIVGRNGPTNYIPRAKRLSIVETADFQDILEEDVLAAMVSVIQA